MTMINNALNKVELTKMLITQDLNLASQVELLQQLSIDNITGEELAEITKLLLAQSDTFRSPYQNALDFVGTGGDNSNSFNISTTTSFILSACGYPVFKHGNRSITSKCGSFDCLEALNIAIPENKDQALQQIKTHHITFLYAPYFHPQFKHFADARKQLAREKIKTLFNIMGPLLNPAGVKNIVIGVFKPELIKPMISALQLLNYDRAIVLHGNGMDEANLIGETHIAKLHNNQITYQTLKATDIGLASCGPEELIGDEPAFNAKILTAILNNKLDGPKKDIVLYNAAIALSLMDEHLTLQDALVIANNAIKSGKTKELLQGLTGDKK